MFDCKVLDAMRSCYSYTGEYVLPGDTEPTVGRITYYFICDKRAGQFNVPYGSHFYGGLGQAAGHQVLPPDYRWEDGGSPFFFPQCGCCEDGRPIEPGCLCPLPSADLALLFLEDPWGIDESADSGLWSRTSHEYRGFEAIFPPDSGYLVEGLSYDADLDTWFLHVSTPTDFLDIPLVRGIPTLCIWSAADEVTLGPGVITYGISFNPNG